MLIARGEQRPEQHRSSIGRRSTVLGFDPSLEFLMQSSIRSLFSGFAIGSRQAGEG